MALVGLAAAVGVRAGALGHGEHQLALLRLTGREHGHRHGLACGVEVGGDGGEVVDGGGHVLGLVDVAIVGADGEEGKALSPPGPASDRRRRARSQDGGASHPAPDRGGHHDPYGCRSPPGSPVGHR